MTALDSRSLSLWINLTTTSERLENVGRVQGCIHSHNPDIVCLLIFPLPGPFLTTLTADVDGVKCC